MNFDVTQKRSGRPGARSPGGFYGWWILAISILVFGASAVGQTQGFSVLLVPLQGDTRLEPQKFALSFLVGGLLGAVVLPFIGRLIDDFGPRAILLWSSGIYIGALLALAVIPVQQSTLGALLVLRMVSSTSLWLGASVLVSLWFLRRRGLALGLFIGVGSSLLTIGAYGLSVLVQELGVVVSLLIFAALMTIVLIPVLIWGVADKPSLMSQYPDGEEIVAPDSQDGEKQDGEKGVADPDLIGVTASQAYRTPLAWILTAGGALQAFVVTGYVFNEAVIFMEQGATAHDAARSLIPQALANAASVLIICALVDRFRMRWMVTVAMAQIVLCIWWGYNLYAFGSTWLFAANLGVCLGLIFGYATAVFPQVYGVRHVGEIRGRFGAASGVAGACGAWVFTFFDVDSAEFLIIGIGAVAAIIAAASWFAPWPTPIEEPGPSPAA